jgi:hypothetical protein
MGLRLLSVADENEGSIVLPTTTAAEDFRNVLRFITEKVNKIWKINVFC